MKQVRSSLDPSYRSCHLKGSIFAPGHLWDTTHDGPLFSKLVVRKYEIDARHRSDLRNMK